MLETLTQRHGDTKHELGCPWGGDVGQHERIMAEGAQDDEDVPDLVKAKDARKWVWLLEYVDDRSTGKEQPS